MKAADTQVLCYISVIEHSVPPSWLWMATLLPFKILNWKNCLLDTLQEYPYALFCLFFNSCNSWDCSSHRISYTEAQASKLDPRYWSQNSLSLGYRDRGQIHEYWALWKVRTCKISRLSLKVKGKEQEQSVLRTNPVVQKSIEVQMTWWKVVKATMITKEYYRKLSIGIWLYTVESLILTIGGPWIRGTRLVSFGTLCSVLILTDFPESLGQAFMSLAVKIGLKD